MANMTDDAYRSFIAKIDAYRDAAKSKGASDKDTEDAIDLAEGIVAALSAADLASSSTASEAEAIMTAIGDGDVLLDDMRRLIGGCAITIDTLTSCIKYLRSLRSKLADSSAGYIKSAVIELLGEGDSAYGKSLIDRINEKTSMTRPRTDSVYIIPKVKLSYNASSRSSFANLIMGYSRFYELAGEYTSKKKTDSRSMSDILGIQDPTIADLVDEIDMGIAAKSGCPLIKAGDGGAVSDLLKLILTSAYGDGSIDDFYGRNASLADASSFLTKFSGKISELCITDASAFEDSRAFEIRDEYLLTLANELRSRLSGGINADDLIYDIMEYDVLSRIFGMAGKENDDIKTAQAYLESKLSDMIKANSYISGLINHIMADGRFRRGI